MSGVDLTVLEGVDEGTALVILSEVGADVSRFATVKQLTSGLGQCPQHQRFLFTVTGSYEKRAAGPG